jgi:hypothetical protein
MIMVVNWFMFALSIVTFILSIVTFVGTVRNIRRNFRNACYWSWRMRKNKDTFTNEEVDNLNWREWNNIYSNISYCWLFGSGFWALSVVFVLASFGIIG